MSIVATATGMGLLAIALALPRRVARTPWRLDVALLLDIAAPLLIFALVAVASGRPVFAGLVVVALAAGYAYADRAKRATLQEPVIFTDFFQAFDIFRHPQLALPFPHKGRVVLGVVAVLGAFVGLYCLEPRTGHSPWWLALGLVAGLMLLAVALRRPLPAGVLRFLQCLGASGSPEADAARLGPLAMHWVHALLAAGERAARREAALAEAAAWPGHDGGGPVVVVQSESFFDARRLHASIDRNLLPGFDAACRDGLQWGRLSVPCWGANTVRTEFAVLSGLAPEALGFDRFNPYHRFADAPVDTLAWRMRARGYRTFFVHPFDGRFYGRDRIVGNLGFDELIDESAFPADVARVQGYIGDQAVARLIADLLRRHGPRIFVFAVTMENHGPWHAPVEQPDDCECLSLSPAPERRALRRYLYSLRNADRMLASLCDLLRRDYEGATLAFYGDHLPGFSSSYRQFGLADRRSDYLIWRSASSAGARVDLCAQDLSRALLAEPTRRPPAVRGRLASTV